MNKEVIKKYKECFDYWLDGGKLLHHYKIGAEWRRYTGSEFIFDGVVVQDDEYAEFRKALADGKTIEALIYRSNGCGGFDSNWYDDCEVTFKLPVKNYRIKPDEPTYNNKKPEREWGYRGDAMSVALIIKRNTRAINDGRVLKTSHSIMSFKLFGNLYTTNKKRSLSRPYSFDDPSWEITNNGLFYKLKLLITGKVNKFQSV